MEQIDLFEEKAYAKLARLEKWMARIQRQITCIQDDLYLTKAALQQKQPPLPKSQSRGIFIPKQPSQLTFFLN
jgi:hypothetical protein